MGVWVYRCNPQRNGVYPGSFSVDLFSSPQKVAEWLVRDEGDIFTTTLSSYDYSGDGGADIVLSSTAELGTYPAVDVYTWQGSSLWYSNIEDLLQGLPDGTPCFYDVDSDGEDEVIVAPLLQYSPQVATAEAYDTDGSLLWSTQLFFYPNLSGGDLRGGSLILGDTLFVLLGGCLDSDTALLACLDPRNGQIFWTDTVPGTVGSVPAFGDVDGDGEGEVVITVGDKLRVYSLSGSLEEEVSLGSYLTTPALADADGDGDLEVYAFSQGDSALYIWNDDSPAPTSVSVGAYNYTRYIAWEVYNRYPPPAVGDVDGDGYPDAVLDLGDRIVIVDGSDLSVRTSPATFLTSSPVLGDFDADGRLELLVGGAPDDTTYRCNIEGWDYDTVSGTFQMLWEFNSPPWDPNFPLNDPIYGDIVVDNFIPNDSFPEIAAVDYSCWIIVLDLPTLSTDEGEKERSPRVFWDGRALEAFASTGGVLELYDPAGRLVLKGFLHQGKNRIAVRLRPGVYIAKLEDRSFKVAVPR